MSETKQKHLGEVAAKQLVQEIEARFSPVKHTHTAEDVGADSAGSAAAALALAEQNTQTKIDELSSAVDTKLKEKAPIQHVHDTDTINYNGKSLSTLTVENLNEIIFEIDERVGIYGSKISGLEDHKTNTIIHVTQADKDAWNAKADETHNHKVSDISDLTVSAAELNYVDGATSNIQEQLDTLDSNKVNTSALSNYYTKSQVDSLELITTDDIDTICGAVI